MIFASFIRDADGVLAIRKVLGEKGKYMKIVPKIENQQVPIVLIHVRQKGRNIASVICTLISIKTAANEFSKGDSYLKIL